MRTIFTRPVSNAFLTYCHPFIASPYLAVNHQPTSYPKLLSPKARLSDFMANLKVFMEPRKNGLFYEGFRTLQQIHDQFKNSPVQHPDANLFVQDLLYLWDSAISTEMSTIPPQDWIVIASALYMTGSFLGRMPMNEAAAYSFLSTIARFSIDTEDETPHPFQQDRYLSDPLILFKDWVSPFTLPDAHRYALGGIMTRTGIASLIRERNKRLIDLPNAIGAAQVFLGTHPVKLFQHSLYPQNIYFNASQTWRPPSLGSVEYLISLMFDNHEADVIHSAAKTIASQAEDEDIFEDVEWVADIIEKQYRERPLSSVLSEIIDAFTPSLPIQMRQEISLPAFLYVALESIH